MSYDYNAIIAGLVTNRTSAVNYGVDDFNRVEYAVEAMAALIRESTCYYYEPVVKTDWTNTNTWGNWPSKENMRRYLQNVKRLLAGVAWAGIAPMPVSMEYLTYREANAIEKSLAGFYLLVQSMLRQRRLCNTFRCGE